ncbi:MAG: hypothetical protein JHD16_08585 [Solirubrobacteraceae bacterium]|nr:hypothetical protein [Solirubrobacteraceae bacterium]
MSFLAMKASTDASPLGAQQSIEIISADSRLSSDEVYRTLSTAASDAGVTLLKREVGVSENSEVFIRLGPGRKDVTSAPDGRQIAFDPSRTLVVKTATVSPVQDVRGRYYVEGPPDGAASLERELRSRGFVLEVARYSHPAMLRSIGSDPRLLPAAVLLLMVSWLVIAYSALAQQRTVAVARLAGDTGPRIVGRRLFETVKLAVLAGGLVAGLVGALLWQYNGLQYGAELIGLGLALFAVVVVSFLAVDGIATMVVVRGSLLEALGGATATGAIHKFSGGSKAIAIVALLSLVPAAYAALGAYRESREAEPRWLALAEYAGLTHSFLIQRYSPQETVDYNERYRSFLIAQNRRGRAIVSVLLGNPDATDNYAPDSGNVLLVNRRYLRENEVRSASGRRIEATNGDGGVATLLVPAGARIDHRRLREQFMAWFRFQRGLPGEDPRVPLPKLETVAIEPGQRLFNYRYSQDSGLAGSVSSGPVVLVVEPDARFVSTDLYSSASSQGQIAYLGVEAVQRSLARHGLAEAVPRAYGIAGLARSEVAAQQRQSLIAWSLVIVSLLASFACSALIARVYCDAQKNRHLIERLHGVTFWRRHLGAAGLLLALYGLALGAVAFLGKVEPLVVGLLVGLLAVDAAFTGSVTRRYEGNLGKGMVKWGL